MKKILVVEDEKNISQIIRDALEDAGYIVTAARDGKSALELALSYDIDLIILDLMLPGIDGFDICRKIRKKNLSVPIIMLTAKTAEADKISGLDLGADDYMTKPFSVKELIARVKACLRRVEIHRCAKTSKIGIFKFGDVVIDFLRMEASKKSRKITFTKKEFDILKYMINRKNEIVSRYDLLDAVWGYNESLSTRTVDIFMHRIRKKIESKPSDPKYLKGVRNAGYKLEI